MNTYTEKELKDWFDKMKKEYKNSTFYNHLIAVEYEMFDNHYSKKNTLENFIKEKN